MKDEKKILLKKEIDNADRLIDIKKAELRAMRVLRELLQRQLEGEKKKVGICPSNNLFPSSGRKISGEKAKK